MKTFIAVILLLIGYYFVYQEIHPPQFKNTESLSQKNRFTNGSFVFFEELDKSARFDIELRDSTLYQILESDSSFASAFIIMGPEFDYRTNTEILLDPPSQRRLLRWVHDGGTVMITGDYGQLPLILDTLEITVKEQYLHEGRYLGLAHEQVKEETKRNTIEIDNSWCPIIKNYNTFTTSVILSWGGEYAAMTHTPFGDGAIIYTPVKDIFENYYMLKGSGPFLGASLAYMNMGSTLWKDFSPKTGENDSIFRVFQAEGPLKWAYYIALIGSLTFLISASRRRQRAIPLLKEKKNDLLLFATSISHLYRSGEGYYTLLKKRYSHLMLHIKRRYGIEVEGKSGEIEKLSKKSGVPEESIKAIINRYRGLSATNRDGKIPRADFVELSRAIDEFYRKSE